MNSLTKNLEGPIKRIIFLQREDGCIPWTENGVFDAWNHLECVMALNTLGYSREAELGFTYLQKNQLKDGSWLGQLGSTLEIDENKGTFLYRDKNSKIYFRDTNFAAYIATACWHDFLVNKSINNLTKKWNMIENAINFVIANQMHDGAIRWAAKSPEAPKDDSLLTGCCSIYKSMICAINCAAQLKKEKPEWIRSLKKLENTIRNKPESFDKTWESKKRFSMDWYYPVLCGVIDRKKAEERINSQWNEYVLNEKGCLCVSDQPWVTIAETAELAIALIKIEKKDKARELLSWIEGYIDTDGAYWMGRQVDEKVFWPMEKPGWTSAAVILAYDALNHFSKGSKIFLDDRLI